MRGVIVGFGTIAMGHAYGYALQTSLSVTAVVDPSPQRREVAKRLFGFRGYSDFDEMLAHEDPDFIDVCSPPHTHTDYVTLAVKNNRHVLCEKPVFMPSEEGYAQFVDRLTASDRICYPCHNYKFAPILEFMQGIVRSPDFGQVLSARFRTIRSGHARGVPEWKPDWRRKAEYSGGGILRDHGPHSIYLATHLTGSTPASVSCLTGSLRTDSYDTEDTALLTIRCEDGAQIVLDLSWSGSYRHSYYSIIGSAGSVVVENDDVCYTRGGEVIRTVLASDFDDPSHRTWFSRMFADFVDVVANPSRQRALLQEAAMTSIVIDAAYESAAAYGAWVDLDIPRIGHSPA